MSFALDFQKRGGYMQYVSPEMAAYKPEYRSTPEGYWTWGALVMAAIAYNPKLVTREEAPKTYQDMLDPKWTDAISVKVSISGLQHVEWYVLRQLYGNDFWPKLVPLRPHAFDSYVQQFDRLVNGQDKVALTAQYSGYLSMKAKGAPVEFVYPARRRWSRRRSPGACQGGAASGGSELFMDWFLGVPGQSGNVEALFYPLAARRCAAAARRREHQRVQAADPDRLARIRADPRAVRARVGQDHRPALNGDRCASRAISPRQIVMPLVVLLCGALVLYPIGFLINESLNVGDPSIFPPEEYGLDNYTNLIDDYRALDEHRCWSPASPPCSR